jgi:hypothetical protein
MHALVSFSLVSQSISPLSRRACVCRREEETREREKERERERERKRQRERERERDTAKEREKRRHTNTQRKGGTLINGEIRECAQAQAHTGGGPEEDGGEGVDDGMHHKVDKQGHVLGPHSLPRICPHRQCILQRI